MDATNGTILEAIGDRVGRLLLTGATAVVLMAATIGLDVDDAAARTPTCGRLEQLMQSAYTNFTNAEAAGDSAAAAR